MLECVVNISEGSHQATLETLTRTCGHALLDVHSDEHHNRSVFTLAGPDVVEAVRRLASEAVRRIDVTRHSGVHPRIGAVDVVPFVPLPGGATTMADALEARNDFSAWFGAEHGVPCFHYGPERTLPEIRRHAFGDLVPDRGPREPHPTAGACAVGARDILVAYNLWLTGTGMDDAKQIAASLRSDAVRALALNVGGAVQVSCNLVKPAVTGPGAVYDLVARLAPIERAELVGLIPRSVLVAEPQERWAELDIDENKTIEARLGTGLDAGKI